MVLISGRIAYAISSAFLGVLVMATPELVTAADERHDSVYDFSPIGIDGSPKPLTAFKNKVLVIVNTASRCGFTPQYEGLEALYKKYADKGLVVLGFPSNDYGGQEPGSNEDIKKFCSVNYDITFPLFGKVPVKGTAKVPLFQYLTSHVAPPGEIKWNFEKFIIGRDGKVAERFLSSVTPSDKEFIAVVERELAS